MSYWKRCGKCWRRKTVMDDEKTTNHNADREDNSIDFVGGRFGGRPIPFPKGVEPDGDGDCDRDGLGWTGRDRLFGGRGPLCRPDGSSHADDGNFGFEAAESERAGSIAANEEPSGMGRDTGGDPEWLGGLRR